MSSLSADLIAWDRQGLGRAYLRFLFPVLPTCEFSNMPLHGCECNRCWSARLDELPEVT